MIFLRRGGKAVMAFALNPDLPSGILSQLIVADIAPTRGKLSNEFTNYIDGMLKVETEQLAKSKNEAFELLEDCEKVGKPPYLILMSVPDNFRLKITG